MLQLVKVTSLAHSCVSATNLFTELQTRGSPHPIEDVLQLVRSGSLIAWLSAAAAEPPRLERIPTDWFKRGMSICPSGRLMSGSVAQIDMKIPSGYVWFDRADLVELGLITPVVFQPPDDASSKRRAVFVQRFTIAQRCRCPRRWISVREIADWCARERGGTKRDEERGNAAWHDLMAALLDGKFERNCRSQVLCLVPELADPVHREPTRLETDWARELLKSYSEKDFISLVMAHCWIPADVCRRWFEAQRIDPPGDWFSSASLPALDGDAAAQAELRPKPTGRAVHQFFQDRVANWPDDQPAPSERADWNVVKRHFAPGLSRDEFRLVRKEVTPPPWREQGKRPRWGIAKKSTG